MRSVKAGREPRGRRCRTPRRKARCRAARLSRRCPSYALVAWGDAVTTVKEKDVAARFRRGDVLLKPQYEPDDGRITMRDATRTVGTASSAQRRDGAQGMRTGWRRRGESGTRTQRGRKGEEQVAQPAAFAEREEAWNDPRRDVKQLMKPEFKAWTRSSLIHTSRSRFVVRDGHSANAGREPSDGVRDANTTARRADGLVTSAALDPYTNLPTTFAERPQPARRCLEQPSLSPSFRTGEREASLLTPSFRRGQGEARRKAENNSNRMKTT